MKLITLFVVMRTHEVNGHRCEVKKAQTKEQAAGMGRGEWKLKQQEITCFDTVFWNVGDSMNGHNVVVVTDCTGQQI